MTTEGSNPGTGPDGFVGLTERGKAVAAGFNALAADGDDTLTVPADDATRDQSTGTDEGTTDGPAEQAGETETPDPGADATAPGPADIPAPPVIETADEDTSAAETRTE